MISTLTNMRLIVMLIVLLRQCTSLPVTTVPDDISTELGVIRTYFNMPGLLGVALKNGKIVGQGAAGYRRQGDSPLLAITDRINLGSCSKWMTATIAGRLVDRKLLSWTTQVHECFPNYSRFNSAFRNATLEQFLAHRSGVEQSITFYRHHWNELMAQKGSIREIRHWVAETVMIDAPEVKPGEFLYANQGYAVAAAMMEHVTGQAWETLLQEHIFTPLDMTSGMVGIVYNDSLPSMTPVGHDLPNSQTVPIPRPTPSDALLHNDQAALGSAGYIACTPEDWLKFLRVHIIGVEMGYLSSETDAKLKRPYMDVEGYGLGVSAYNRTWGAPGQVLTHGGDIFGQDTVFWMSPSHDFILVAYTNCRSDNNRTSLALDNAARLLVYKYSDGPAKNTRATSNDRPVLDRPALWSVHA
jgi:CubicO group peptidase (beta-lactamase class C family)